MKTISLMMFALMLLNQDDNLIKQHHAEVNVYDVDAYIHDLPNEVRRQISYDKNQLEKDIFGMLNMNIIYDYISKTGLINQPPFTEIVNRIETQLINVDDQVFSKLKVDSKTFKQNYRQYLLKKELYSALQDYLIDQIPNEKAENLAHDRFLINLKDYQVPQKRDLGMIKLSQEKYKQQDVLAVLKSLISNDTVAEFKQQATQFSDDKSVKYNDGQLGQFHKKGFRYPFADEVFSADQGIIPTIFKKDGFWYLVRVNDIIPAKPADFADHRDDMVAKIKLEMMERQFQSIINEYAQHEIKINKELVDDIFSRYEVFQ